MSFWRNVILSTRSHPENEFCRQKLFWRCCCCSSLRPTSDPNGVFDKKKKRIKELKCRGFVITMPHHPTHTVAPAPRLLHPHFSSVSLLFFFYIVFNPKFVSRKPIIPAGEGRVRGKSISGIDHSTKALEVFPELLNSLTTALRTDIKSTISVIVIFSRTKC